MKRITVVCIGTIVLLGLLGHVAPALAMRCGSRIISEGDPRERVLNECGSPADSESWEEERYYDYDAPPPAYQHREFQRYGNAYRVKVHVKVELWTYNYGPSRFMDFVRFENGKVRKIESGGYGY